MQARDVTVSLATTQRPHVYLIVRYARKATQVFAAEVQGDLFAESLPPARVLHGMKWIEQSRRWSKRVSVRADQVIRFAGVTDMRARGVVALTGKALW